MRFLFGEFELDTEAFELRQGDALVPVEPQVFSVLAHLVVNRERLVSRDELLDQVWGHRFVSDATVASRVKGVRRAIGDDGTSQRLVRTVTGRGYRFVGEVEEVDAPAGRRPAPPRGQVPHPPRERVDLVGRSVELQALGDHLEAAAGGEGRLVLVVGVAGAGKSALVDAFCGGLDDGVRVWRGRCLRSEGGGEPYWPVLEALSAASREEDVLERLAEIAPSWVVELPLPPGAVDERVSARALGATRGRRIRELAGALAELSRERPLVLALEDLQWADEPSLELLETLALSGAGSRVLVLGTVRPPEGPAGRARADRVLNELVIRGVARELRLDGLSEAAVAEYLQLRIGVDDVPEWLPALLVERTGGNALFVRALVDAWLLDGRLLEEGGVLVAGDEPELARHLPETARRVVQAQLDGIEEEELRLLEAASVAGLGFSALEVAAAIDADITGVDDRLAELGRHGYVIRASGGAAWPDGTRCGSYTFVHDLYRGVVYEEISGSRRALMHAGVGRALEAAYGPEVGRFYAVPLADHFVAAGDSASAARWLQVAAAQSLARSAHVEAARQARQAIGFLTGIGDSAERTGVEIASRSVLAAAETALRGWAAPEIEAEYQRARELCEASGDAASLSAAVYSLAIVHEYRGEYERSETLMSDQLERATGALVPEALELLACSTFHQGRFGRSLAYAEQGLSTVDASSTSEYLARFGESPVVSYHCWAALDLWFLGREREALEHLQQAFAAAETHLYSLTTAQAQAAFVHQHRGDHDEALRRADETIAVATAQGFPFRVAQATIVRGWAIAASGEPAAGDDELERGLELYGHTGAGMDTPYYLALAAETAARRGDRERALARLREARALLPARGFFYEAPLLGLEATLVARADPAAAVVLLDRALAVAESQGADGLRPRLESLRARALAGEPLEPAG